MKNKSISLLNKALGDELTAVQQYMYFHFHCEDQGLHMLADMFKKTAEEEMHHIGILADRILFLDGDIEMKASRDIKNIITLKEMMVHAIGMEKQSVMEYRLWSDECCKEADATTGRIFENLVHDEEKHYNRYNLELKNLEKYGENYLALHSLKMD